MIASLRSPLPIALVAGALLLGCQACASAASQDPGPREPPPTSSPDPVPPATTEPEPVAPPPAAEPAPALTLDAVRTERGVSVTLTNTMRAPVSFASSLLLEQRGADDTWSAITSRGAFVGRLDAERALPECAELVPGASLELEFADLAGADCTSCEPPVAGDYRFVVTSCGGTGRTEGAAFTVGR